MSDPSDLGQMILRLCCALAAGGMIGWERELQEKPAGLRTNMLVALGAAVVVLAGLQLAKTGIAGENEAAAASRIIQGVVGGIGFLGAGTILQSRHSIHGLTTASALWLSAALGVASGLGLYKLTITAAVLGIVVLTVFALVEQQIRPERDGPAYGKRRSQVEDEQR
jgi:putative Mg2+ transporter-C (MgtC) family protein